ncbi:MAG: hypothetical protein BroJett041_19730 [Candidatus Jettenia caeni]|nr:MAG: hypothetical protein BroJett041_19730 [Candidatus Jettenia caeni]GJQ45145.1 MAG: hypothetical protein JETCAE04_08990 [Candidatus Jettenia caeni]
MSCPPLIPPNPPLKKGGKNGKNDVGQGFSLALPSQDNAHMDTRKAH